jgi:hypothetical protein
MRHAGPAALDKLEPFLRRLRKEAALKERARGTVYRSGRAFLHFHEHGDELYADVRFADDFERCAATTAADRKRLIERIGAALQDGNSRVGR